MQTRINEGRQLKKQGDINMGVLYLDRYNNFNKFMIQTYWVVAKVNPKTPSKIK